MFNWNSIGRLGSSQWPICPPLIPSLLPAIVTPLKKKKDKINTRFAHFPHYPNFYCTLLGSALALVTVNDLLSLLLLWICAFLWISPFKKYIVSDRHLCVTPPVKVPCWYLLVLPQLVYFTNVQINLTEHARKGFYGGVPTLCALLLYLISYILKLIFSYILNFVPVIST